MKLIRSIACFICLFFLFGGIDNTWANKRPQRMVVRKKITASPEDALQPGKTASLPESDPDDTLQPGEITESDTEDALQPEKTASLPESDPDDTLQPGITESDTEDALQPEKTDSLPEPESHPKPVEPEKQPAKAESDPKKHRVVRKKITVRPEDALLPAEDNAADEKVSEQKLPKSAFTSEEPKLVKADPVSETTPGEQEDVLKVSPDKVRETPSPKEKKAPSESDQKTETGPKEDTPSDTGRDKKSLAKESPKPASEPKDKESSAPAFEVAKARPKPKSRPVAKDEEKRTPVAPAPEEKKDIARTTDDTSASGTDPLPDSPKPSAKTSDVSQKDKAIPDSTPKASGTVSDVKKTKPKTDESVIASLLGIKEKKKDVTNKIQPYDPEGKIDPFVPLFKEESSAPKRKAKKTIEVKKEKKGKKGRKKQERVRPRGPLERVDLSQLKLVGVIRAESGNRALVEEATGRGYIIKKGTYIGINSGRVSEILGDRVIVEEEDEDFSGAVTIRKRELKLQKPFGEDYYGM